MKTKKLHFLPILFIGFVTAFTSCSKDDPDPASSVPTIDLSEVGSGNSKTVLAGSDLHLEAQIEAEGLIQRIDIEIHQEEGDFEITESYTEGKYIGVKSIEFHEHIDIPKEAPAGNYHLHFTVTDKAGNSTVAEAELIVNSPVAVIENLKVGSKDVRDDGIANVSYGPIESKLYIGAEIESSIEIESVVVQLTAKNADSNMPEVDITSSFDKATGKLDADLPVPSDLQNLIGTYVLTLTVTDKEGTKTEVNRDVEVSTNPFIEDFELGSGHGEGERTDHIAYIGRDVHIQGMIYCLFNRLTSVRIEITQDVEDNPRKLSKDYNEETGYPGAISGSRNDLFHQHIDIPADMPAGLYNFSILVTDRQGLQYERKLKLELKYP